MQSPDHNPIHGSGAQYWRSLNEFARINSSGCAYDEFPHGAGDWPASAVSRRNFLKLMSASMLLAGVGLTGCRRPEEEILPFAKDQNGVHGVPEYYATAMPRRRSAVPLVVKSHDGRPTKIEGNPRCPGFNGGTDLLAQASILGLYDPDRAAHFAENGQQRTRQQAFEFIAGRRLGDGSGTAFLLEQSSSPSRERLLRQLRAKLPRARWFEYEPIDLDSPADTASLFYAKDVRPNYQIARAKVILAMDCDFLGSEEDAVSAIGKFADTRKLSQVDSSMSRLYAVESAFTLTGANADHRFRVPPSLIPAVTARFALELLGPAAQRFGRRLSELAASARDFENWIVPCARDLKSAGKEVLILPGHRLPVSSQVLVWALNEALGSVGRTVQFHERLNSQRESLANLVQALNSDSVETLVILGSNPAYTAPADMDWPHAQAKAKAVVRLGAYADETSWNPSLHAPVHWDLPAAHYLESWGDARVADGTMVPVQPLIEPLFGGITELELLARIGKLERTTPYEIVRETFAEVGGPGDDPWCRFLHDGFLLGSAAKVASVQPDWLRIADLIQSAPVAAKPEPGKLDVVFQRDYTVDDGCFANNGWLQEAPDPITKITWGNALLVSPATARELNLDPTPEDADGKCQVAELRLDGRTLRGPVWVQPGMADNTVCISLGYGRFRAGRVGNQIGVNAYSIRPSHLQNYAQGASLSKTTDITVLAVTQSHWSMEGRPIVRESRLEEFRKNPDFARKLDRQSPAPQGTLYDNPLDAAKATASNQWGMSIDLSRCVGCSACVIACQSENNIPIVGREMVAKSREMHWIRIDRYYSGSPADPKAVAQPMLCQHCESAPCENVCPVNATVHDGEGLNVMVYNRCVGTRYCSNNCPFKVRRFNFFDYNRQSIDRLYQSPITTSNNGEWELKHWFKDRDRGTKPNDEWQLARMARNPDVSVRMRGVMEKCSFCQQRIEQARIIQRARAGTSAPSPLSEGDNTIPLTACQQACPANAIVFGDVSDPQSKVSLAKKQPRDYRELEHLNIKPRVSYLGKVRNPNPEMPV